MQLIKPYIKEIIIFCIAVLLAIGGAGFAKKPPELPPVDKYDDRLLIPTPPEDPRIEEITQKLAKGQPKERFEKLQKERRALLEIREQQIKQAIKEYYEKGRPEGVVVPTIRTHTRSFYPLALGALIVLVLLIVFRSKHYKAWIGVFSPFVVAVVYGLLA